MAEKKKHVASHFSSFYTSAQAQSWSRPDDSPATSGGQAVAVKSGGAAAVNAQIEKDKQRQREPTSATTIVADTKSRTTSDGGGGGLEYDVKRAFTETAKVTSNRKKESRPDPSVRNARMIARSFAEVSRQLHFSAEQKAPGTTSDVRAKVGSGKPVAVIDIQSRRGYVGKCLVNEEGFGQNYVRSTDETSFDSKEFESFSAIYAFLDECIQKVLKANEDALQIPKATSDAFGELREKFNEFRNFLANRNGKSDPEKDQWTVKSLTEELVKAVSVCLRIPSLEPFQFWTACLVRATTRDHRFSIMELLSRRVAAAAASSSVGGNAPVPSVNQKLTGSVLRLGSGFSESLASTANDTSGVIANLSLDHNPVQKGFVDSVVELFYLRMILQILIGDRKRAAVFWNDFAEREFFDRKEDELAWGLMLKSLKIEEVRWTKVREAIFSPDFQSGPFAEMRRLFRKHLFPRYDPNSPSEFHMELFLYSPPSVRLQWCLLMAREVHLKRSPSDDWFARSFQERPLDEKLDSIKELRRVLVAPAEAKGAGWTAAAWMKVEGGRFRGGGTDFPGKTKQEPLGNDTLIHVVDSRLQGLQTSFIEEIKKKIGSDVDKLKYFTSGFDLSYRNAYRVANGANALWGQVGETMHSCEINGLLHTMAFAMREIGVSVSSVVVPQLFVTDKKKEFSARMAAIIQQTDPGAERTKFLESSQLIEPTTEFLAANLLVASLSWRDYIHFNIAWGKRVDDGKSNIFRPDLVKALDELHVLIKEMYQNLTKRVIISVALPGRSRRLATEKKGVWSVEKDRVADGRGGDPREFPVLTNDMKILGPGESNTTLYTREILEDHSGPGGKEGIASLWNTLGLSIHFPKTNDLQRIKVLMMPVGPLAILYIAMIPPQSIARVAKTPLPGYGPRPTALATAGEKWFDKEWLDGLGKSLKTEVERTYFTPPLFTEKKKGVRYDSIAAQSTRTITAELKGKGRGNTDEKTKNKKQKARQAKLKPVGSKIKSAPRQPQKKKPDKYAGKGPKTDVFDQKEQ